MAVAGCCMFLNQHEDANVHEETFIPDEEVDADDDLHADEEGDVEDIAVACVRAAPELYFTGSRW